MVALSDINLNLFLSSGMPAALALEGRKMTFSQYLITPFFLKYSKGLCRINLGELIVLSDSKLRKMHQPWTRLLGLSVYQS